MTTFSVIIPTFNRAALLGRCLESVAAQTHRDFEVIVADDGSTDETPSVVEQLKTRFSTTNIHFVTQPNRGAADARNLGASVAAGEFLVFLDSDDEALPDWLERMASAIAVSGAELLSCGCRTIGPSGTVLATRLPAGHPHFRAGTFVLRKSLFQRVGGYANGLPANQHSELRIRLLQHCREAGTVIHCLEVPLVHVHMHDAVKVRRNVRAIYEGGVYVLRKHETFLRQHPPTYADWAAAVGASAARLGDFRAARHWFLRALGARPLRLRNYARLVLSAIPVLRSAVWGLSP